MRLRLLVTAIYFIQIISLPNLSVAKAGHSFKKDINVVNTRWIYNPYSETKVKNQNIGSKSLIRYVKLGGAYIPIAQITLTTNLSDKSNSSLQELKNNWTQKAFPDLKWFSNEDESSLNLESYWPQMNRYIHVSVQKLKTGYLSIVTFARMGYLPVVYNDLQDIRSALIHSVKQKENKISSWKILDRLELFFEKAFAQLTGTGVPGLDLNTLLAGGNTALPVTSSANSTYGGTYTTITPIANTITTTAAGGGNAINVNVTGGTINSMKVSGGTANTMTVSADAPTLAAINNATNTANTVAQSNITTSQNIKDGAITASQNAVTASENVYKSTQTMDALARDKGNAFQMAGAAAAGAVVGALVANMIISGVANSVAYIWNELLFDKTNNRIRWENFQKARDAIEKNENAAVQLEKELDGLALVMDSLNAENNDDASYGDLLQQLDARHDQFIVQAEKYKILAGRANSEKDIEACLALANDFQKTAKQIESALQFAKENKINFKNKTNFFCEQFETYKRKLSDTETSLTRLNTMLVAGQNEYFKFRKKELEQEEKDNRYINSAHKMGTFTNSDKEVANTAIEIAENDNSKEKDYFIAQCMAGQNDAGKALKQAYDEKIILQLPSNSKPSAFSANNSTAAYIDCPKLYKLARASGGGALNSKEYLEKIKSEAYKAADEHAKYTSNLYHGINAERVLEDLDENRKWFEKKDIENQCYQKLGKEMTQIEEDSCNRLAPKMMSLYRSHKKANDLWVHNCQKSYEVASNGIKPSAYANIIAQLRVKPPKKN